MGRFETLHELVYLGILLLKILVDRLNFAEWPASHELRLRTVVCCDVVGVRHDVKANLLVIQHNQVCKQRRNILNRLV